MHDAQNDHSPNVHEDAPVSNLTGSAQNLPEFYSLGSFDAYSNFTGYIKAHPLVVWVPVIVVLTAIILVNL